MPEPYLKPSEIARTYNVSYRTVLAWIHQDIEPLEAYIVGGQYRVPPAALDVFVKPVNPISRRVALTQPIRSTARKAAGRNEHNYG